MPFLHSSKSSSTESVRHSSLESYLESGHGRTLPLTSWGPSPSENTPLVTYLPKVRFLPAPSPNKSIKARDTAKDDSPLPLFSHDMLTFFYTIPYLPYALRPWKAKCSAQHGEDCTDGGNGDWSNWRTKRDDIVVGLASVCQALTVPIVPAAFAALPGMAFVLAAVVYGSANWALVSCLRGKKIVQSSEFDGGEETHRRAGGRERWYFINGIMTGREGVESSVNHISRIFGRPVTGIHNWTTGFFGDIGECLIQRCFSYSTTDVRVTYDHVRSCLVDPEVDKVVLLAHSQGGIVASLVVDKLLTELPQDCVGKLEIYTFGSAASHFSNPLLSLTADSKTLQLQTQKDNTKSHLNDSHQETKTVPLTESQSSNKSIQDDKNNLDSSERGLSRTIPHIEHYANELDPIPRWGVLHSISDLASPLYAGRVFIRLGASGHLFSKHYLAALFPMDKSERGCFWEREVEVDEDVERRRSRIDRVGSGAKNGVATGNGDMGQCQSGEEGVQWGDGQFRGCDEWREVEEERGEDGLGDIEFLRKVKGKKVRELGRLWAYVDGGVPDD